MSVSHASVYHSSTITHTHTLLLRGTCVCVCLWVRDGVRDNPPQGSTFGHPVPCWLRRLNENKQQVLFFFPSLLLIALHLLVSAHFWQVCFVFFFFSFFFPVCQVTLLSLVLLTTMEKKPRAHTHTHTYQEQNSSFQERRHLLLLESSQDQRMATLITLMPSRKIEMIDDV